MHETQLRSPGQKDSLEKGMATHSSVFASRIPQTEEPGRLQSMGSQNSWTWLRDWTVTALSHSLDLFPSGDLGQPKGSPGLFLFTQRSKSHALKTVVLWFLFSYLYMARRQFTQQLILHKQKFPLLYFLSIHTIFLKNWFFIIKIRICEYHEQNVLHLG